MKFSHTLRFNAVPDWIDYYVAYDNLKKLIFQIEKERVEAAAAYHRSEASSSSSTASQQGSNHDIESAHPSPPETLQGSEDTFLGALDLQLDKVVDFYSTKEKELYDQLEQLPHILATTTTHGGMYLQENQASEFERSPLEKIDSTPHLDKPHRKMSFESRFSSRSEGTGGINIEAMLDTRSLMITLYVSLSELESYVDLNKSAFDKILKKHDKVLDGNLREPYNKKMVQESVPFTPQSMEKLRVHIERLERMYADTFCGGQVEIAVRQMKTHLRDQITYDRNTVWRDMIGQERKTLAAHIVEPTPVKTVRIPFTQFTVPSELFREIVCFAISVAALIILLNVDTFNNREENYCFALLIFAAIMWATEAVPLYATSLLIPFLIVPMQIIRNDDGSTMAAKDAAKEVFASMFSGTIMMLLGGFALAGALSKYGIAKAFASHVLSRAGTRPRWVLLAIMFVAGFLSMWISNVATPVLCFSLIDPILRTLPDNSRVAPCLLLGIALASCIGGMTSPISSPQNIVTLQYMNPNPGWGIWFGAALPISIISVFVCWGILLLVYRPDKCTPHLNKIKPTRGKISYSQIYIMFITLATIALWCAETAMEDAIGSTGVIAAIPLFMFFGTGILKKDDLHQFLWSVVVLAQGGMALGFAVTSSGLLQDIAIRIKDGIEHLDAITILCIFAFLILVFSTFVSHTVAALIIIPIVQQVGENLPVPRPNLLVMGAGLACSAGMALPVSGYPNMSAVMLENAAGKPYLSSKDFLIVGIPTSVFATILIFTLGYGILSGVGY
ncbi:SPX domain-containing protein [Phascolomyces articulosus]|uniref:SPX domain-containing protein n=1 Tax=Phascolomyces articulosus TaxID=60185 RepID=A0AAD5KIF6_9FUNG|nr:SPX domain-containing protein [Phascolomyces articulosus]